MSLSDGARAETVADTAAAGQEPAQPEAPAPILDVEEPTKPLPLPELLMGVMQGQGKSLTQVVAELAKLSFAPSRLAPEEYFDLRLYDDAALAGADKRAFLGMKGCKWVGLEANQNPYWFALVTEKLPFYAVMGAYGLPTIRQKAVFHPRVRLPGLGSLADQAELTAFLRNPANFPLFGKPVSASLSLGTVSVDACDGATGELTLASGRKVAAEALAAEIARSYRDGYMLQERLEPHAEMRSLAGNRIGTIRVYTIMGAKGPEVFRVCWKVPAGRNMADNFWRSGNMLAALDEATGTVKRVIRGTGPRQEEPEVHPDTGAKLVGAVIPGWQEIVDLALWGARVAGEIPLLGWDIAQTDRGPVLVEANNTPDFRLVQMAERRGVYDERLKGFLELCRQRYAGFNQGNLKAANAVRQRGLQKVWGSLRKGA